jgi:hypothetical protein
MAKAIPYLVLYYVDLSGLCISYPETSHPARGSFLFSSSPLQIQPFQSTIHRPSTLII